MKIKLKHISWFLLGLALFFYSVETYKYKPEEDYYKEDKLCLKEALYHEARNTSKEEKIAILEVILNRYRSTKFPDSICKVIDQPWQFSFKNHMQDKSKIILPRFQEINSILDKEAYYEILNIVESKFKDNRILPNIIIPESTLYYHLSTIKKPYWARSKKMQEVKIPVDLKFKHGYYLVIN